MQSLAQQGRCAQVQAEVRVRSCRPPSHTWRTRAHGHKECVHFAAVGDHARARARLRGQRGSLGRLRSAVQPLCVRRSARAGQPGGAHRRRPRTTWPFHAWAWRRTPPRRWSQRPPPPPRRAGSARVQGDACPRPRRAAQRGARATQAQQTRQQRHAGYSIDTTKDGANAARVTSFGGVEGPPDTSAILRLPGLVTRMILERIHDRARISCAPRLPSLVLECRRTCADPEAIWSTARGLRGPEVRRPDPPGPVLADPPAHAFPVRLAWRQWLSPRAASPQLSPACSERTGCSAATPLCRRWSRCSGGQRRPRWTPGGRDTAAGGARRAARPSMLSSSAAATPAAKRYAPRGHPIKLGSHSRAGTRIGPRGSAHATVDAQVRLRRCAAKPRCAPRLRLNERLAQAR
jgi:hypothetical protein